MCTWRAWIVIFQKNWWGVGEGMCVMWLWILLVKLGNQLTLIIDLHFDDFFDNPPRLLHCSYLQNAIKLDHVIIICWTTHTYFLAQNHDLCNDTLSWQSKHFNWKSVALGFKMRICRHYETQDQDAQWGPYVSLFYILVKDWSQNLTHQNHMHYHEIELRTCSKI